jgi:hypothetical protein
MGTTKETVDLVLRVKGDADKKIGKMGAASKKTGMSMAAMASTVAGPLTAALIPATVAIGAMTAAVTAAAVGYVKLVSSTIDLIDETNTLANATGLSHASISGLRLAADAAGKSLTDIIPKNLAKKMADAAAGSTATAEQFAALGVDVQDSSGELRDADKVYQEVVRSLLTMENRTEAAGLAAQLLGKQGRETLSAFSSVEQFGAFSSMAGEFGRDTGPGAAAAAGEMQQAMAILRQSMEFAKATALEFGPSFRTMADFTVDAAVLVVGAVEWINQGLKGMKANYIDVFDGMLASFKRLGKLLSGELSLGQFIAEGLKAGEDQIDRTAKRAEVAMEQVTGAMDRFRDLTDTIRAPGEKDDFGGGSSGGGGAAESGLTAGDLTGIRDAFIEGLIPSTVGLGESLDTMLFQLELQFRRMMTNNERLFKEAKFDAMAEGLQAMSAEIPATLEGLLEKVPIVGGLLATISEIVFNLPDLIRGLLSDIVGKISSLPGMFTDLLVSIPREIVDAIPDLIEGIIMGAIDFLVARFLKMPIMLIKLIPRIFGALFEGFKRAITESIPETIREVGRLIDNAVWKLLHPFKNKKSDKEIIKSAKSQARIAQAAITGEVPAFGNGAIVTRPTFAMVGDKGPEGVFPLDSPHGQRAMGGGSGATSVNITINGYASDRARRELIRELNQVLGGRGLGPNLRTA